MPATICCNVLMQTPSPQSIADAAGVTAAYARMLLNGERRPSLDVALKVYDVTGYQCGPLAGLTKREIETARKMAA